MKLKEWGAFALLGLIWGSSFLWIKIAVEEIGPFTLVALRLLFGLAGLLLIMRLRGQAFPRDRRVLLAFLFMGAFNTAIPFTLISWGETKIDSGLASILNGTVPLFTIVIAHFWLHDEKITLPRLAGLIVGFVGMVTLVSRDLGPEGLRGNVWGQFAVIAGSICYATAITFSRRYLRGQPPVVQSTMILLVADALMWIATPLVESPIHLPALPMTWLAIVWLGVLGSCVAYLLFFFLINAWGPTRASLVTYVFPVIGLLLGILFLKETADWRLLIGSVLIVGGILVVNVRHIAHTALVKRALAAD
jgi:drug/metabolite transporter (DMT)-like permease